MQTLNNEGFISIFQLWSLLHIGVGLTLFHLPHLSKTYVLNEIVYTLVLCKLLTWRCSVLRLIPISDSRIEYMDPFNHFFCCPYDCSDVICCHGFNAHSIDILSCIVLKLVAIACLTQSTYTIPTAYFHETTDIWSFISTYIILYGLICLFILLGVIFITQFGKQNERYYCHLIIIRILLIYSQMYMHSYCDFVFGLRWRLVSTKRLYYQLQLVS